MQIHELTYKSLQEGVITDLAKGVGSQLTQKIVQSQTGTGPDRFAGQRVATGDRRGGAAMAANMPALQLMSKQAQAAWVQIQQQLAQKSNPPVASAALLPTDQLKPHLTALINQLAGFDYTKEPGAENTAPEMALGIKNARDTINRQVDEILGLTKEKPEQAKQPLQAAWTELVTKGIGPMQTYQQNVGSVGKPSSASATQQSTNPEADKLVNTIGKTGLAAMAQHVQGKAMTKTNIPAIDGLFAQLGATVR